MNQASLPALFSPRACALFLDLDGTLIDFGNAPMDVEVSPPLLALLGDVRDATEGALAIVSGRSITTIDALLAPMSLPLAGMHGLERRAADGRVHRHATDTDSAVEAVSQRLHAFAAQHAGLLVEDKGLGVALHYRAVPGYADTVAAFADDLEASLADDLIIQRGHMVVEIRPAGADKGTAIAAFMHEAPFHGRQAVFVGDDRTDEHGFAVVNAMHGSTIKVGAGSTVAAARLPDPAAVICWLGDSIDLIRTKRIG
jgi:trehalose 6-phosphate phosphatase